MRERDNRHPLGSLLFFVFTVTQSKTTNADYYIQNVQILGHERTKIDKDPRQESGLCEILYARYSGKTFYLSMETPCCCPFRGHKYGGRKATERSLSFPPKAWNHRLRNS